MIDLSHIQSLEQLHDTKRVLRQRVQVKRHILLSHVQGLRSQWWRMHTIGNVLGLVLPSRWTWKPMLFHLVRGAYKLVKWIRR